jgi:predicted nucleotidyltransferase
MDQNLRIPHRQIAEFCARRHIARLRLFGSVLRHDFGPHSDIDVLVEFEAGHTPGWEIVDIQDELSAILGRPVDIVNPKYLLPRLRKRILDSAVTEYEAQNAA